MERDQCWLDLDRCPWLESVFACLVDCLPTSFPVGLLHLWFYWFGSVKNEIRQLLNPRDREQDSHPCVNMHREK